jgi:hypothetical protein
MGRSQSEAAGAWMTMHLNGRLPLVPAANVQGRSAGAQRAPLGPFLVSTSSATFHLSRLLENSRLFKKISRENDFLRRLALSERLDFGCTDPYRSGRRAAIVLERERSWAPPHVELDGLEPWFSSPSRPAYQRMRSIPSGRLN